jgi:hypothetical protein
MNRIHFRRGACALLLAFALPGAAEAQIPLVPRAVGLGGAVQGAARGFEAALYNPANLGLADNPSWSVALLQFSLGASVLGPRVSDLPDFFQYDDLSAARRQELLATIPATGTSVDLDVRAPLFALQMGNVGLALTQDLVGEHTVGRDVVELFLEGYEMGRTDYRAGNTVGSRGSFWDLAVGYGREVGPVSVGATAHYYHGTGLVRTRAFEPRYGVVPIDIAVDYVGVSSESGRGFGLDLGVAAQPAPGVTVGATLANVVHSMRWSENLVGRSVTLRSSDFRDGSITDIETRYTTSRRDLGTTPDGQFATVAQGLFEEQRLPTTLRVGASWAPVRGTEVDAAFHTNLREGLLGSRWTQMAGIGIEQRIPLITLRLGAATDLSDGSMVGGGARLGPMDLGFARFSTASTLDGSERDGWIGSFGLSVRMR